MTLDVPELEAQQAQWRAKLRSDLAALEKAKNGPRREEIAAAAAEVAAAEARHARLKQGFREEEIRQAKNDWLSAEADLKLAEENLGRYELLLRRKSITQSQVDMARADFDRARGRAAGVRAHYDLVMRGNRPEEVAEAAALLDQARANLDLLKAGTRAEDIAMMEAQAEQTRARLREVEVNLAEAVVRATGQGVVDIVSVRRGTSSRPDRRSCACCWPMTCGSRSSSPRPTWAASSWARPSRSRVARTQACSTAGISPRSRTRASSPAEHPGVDERRHQVFSAKVRVDDPRGVFKSGMAAEVTVPIDGNPGPPDTGRSG